MRADAPGKASDKSRRRGALPSLREHLMHRTERKPTPQRRIRPGMTKRHPIRRGVVVGFDALDAAAQARKRACACAGHAPLLENVSASVLEEKPEAGSFVHDMF